MSPVNNISYQEAKEFIELWPYQDDFVCRHFRLIGFEGDDNSIDLAYYWQIRKDIVDDKE
jgi:hypothetical protein